MNVERNIAPYAVFAEESIANALRRISDNKAGVVFAIGGNGVLEGVLTDGDLRRWLMKEPQLDLNRPVESAMNRDFVSASADAAAEDIERLLSDRIRFVPLLDRQGRLVGIAFRRSAAIRIGDRVIADDRPTFTIAEIGNNHNGSLELALRLVDLAAEAGADCAKFQLRSMGALYRNAGQADDAAEDLGSQYTLDLLSRFQLPFEDMVKAFDRCREKGLVPLCTPWDVESVALLERYGMPAYKVASADLVNHELLEALGRTHKPLLCSTGMSSEAEIGESVRLLRRIGAQFVLLHCNSTYPAPFKDIHLNYIERLKRIGDCPVGYSGHERGYAVAIAAIAKGARVIEKHFTVDRDMEGNDHKVSLLPSEFAAMVQGIRDVEQALGAGEARRITQGEMMNREVLGKSVVAAREIPAGAPITEDMLAIRSPGKGLSPNRKHELIGRAAPRAFAKGDFFYPADLEVRAVKPRPYRFRRPFGIPVRYHDVRKLASKSNFDLLEFHLSYKDLELDPRPYLDEKGYDMALVVHAPELFAGDHIMDLCSADPAYRRRSIEELQRVIDVTRMLKPYFRRSQKPPIVINAGGFSFDGPLPKSRRPQMYDAIAESLSAVDSDGVEITPQTMPPFPWHFGGQRFHNLFMDAEDISAFCKAHGVRICLDVSHAKLACNHAHVSFKHYVEEVGPFAAHLHIVDAEGVDGEGLQIGEGDIDFEQLAESLDRTAPGVSFIPEIWQGHKNDGEGFWIALERLEKVL